MSGEFALATTRVEWEDEDGAPLRHEVEDYDLTFPKASVTDQTSKTPMGGRTHPRVGSVWAEMGFVTSLAGSGDAGTPPHFHKLLECCGFACVRVVDTSVTYTLDGTLRGSYDDGNAGGDTDDQMNLRMCIGNAYEQEIADARGNGEIRLVAEEEAKIKFEMAGTYVEPDEDDVDTDLCVTSLAPVCKAITATIGGKTLSLKSLTIPFGCETPKQTNMCAATGIDPPSIVDQNPSITAVFTHPIKSDLNIWSLFTTEAKIAFSIVLGSVAGNIITILMDGYMKAPPEHSDQSKLLGTTINCDMSWDDADQQLSIAFT